MAEATGVSLAEAKILHAEADTDGDGIVSLEEFKQAKSLKDRLPKPVRAAPIRKPVDERPATPQQQPMQQQPQQWQQQPQQQQPMQQQPQQWQQQPQQQQPQQWQQQPQQQQPQQWQQQPMQQQPRQQQPDIQPTIPSGIRCRGCGIGVVDSWRFCPICGTQQLR